MSWECTRLPSAISYRDGMGRLLGCFLREFFASGTPEEMALFKARRPEEDGRLLVYLTPIAAKLCRPALDGLVFEPCDPPPREQVSMVAGHMASRDLLVGD